MAAILGTTTACECVRLFMNKRGEEVVVVPLDVAAQADRLIERYLAYRPRNSFQGLPPPRDEVCLAWVRQMVREGTNFLALSAADEILGHAGLFAITARVCELLVVVWPEFQNTGIGTVLVEHMIEVGRDLGFAQMALWVESHHTRARRVYEKCGFLYQGRACWGEIRMVRRLV